MTFGCSESTRTLLFHAGLNEETCTFRCHAEFFSAGDPAINPNLDGFGTFFELGE